MTDLDRLARQIAEEVLAELTRSNGAGPDSCCGGGPGSKCQTQGCPSSGGCRQCAAHVPEKVAEIVACGANRIEGGLGVGRVRPDLAGYIDHTLLKPEATYTEIQTLCREAALYGFCSVCINPCWVTHCAELLKGSAVKVCTVIGFPLGATTTDIKVLEARQAQENGATELDMVINVGALKTGDRKYVEQDIRAVVEEARPGVLVKVILETGLLNDEEKVTACELSRAAGADFVKTSTGFGPGGATASDIALMRSIVGPEMGVKASGGVKDCQRADLMVRAGATRIGASAGVAIVSQCKAGGPVKAPAGY